jgi:GTP-binding protein
VVVRSSRVPTGYTTRDAEVEENKPEEVKFKWEDYHQEQLAEHQFDDEDDDWDDWDEEDEEGVEFIYKP